MFVIWTSLGVLELIFVILLHVASYSSDSRSTEPKRLQLRASTGSRHDLLKANRFCSPQKNARHPETFAPLVHSMKPEDYSDMVHAMHLPTRAIESSSCVGPFFWAGMSTDKQNPCLRLLMYQIQILAQRQQGQRLCNARVTYERMNTLGDGS